KKRQHLHYLFGQRLIIGFPRIQPDGTEMPDTELGCPEALPADQAAVIIAERINTRPWLPDPESGLNNRRDASIGHGLVVVRRPRHHVDMRVEKPETFYQIQFQRNSLSHR